MEKNFNNLSDSLFSELNNEENLILSFSGENSQFVRFNNASVRQTGIVDDGDLGLKFCLLYTSPSPRDRQKSRMPSSA